jgi:L-seryl-tRNA(Ser) seleniumtransferase
MSIYKKLGVKPIINCYDTYTLLGGPIIPREVIDAMVEADRTHAWLWELEEKAGKRIAELIGAEAAFVTPGAFAALALSAAACMAGKDPEKMKTLPDTSGMKNEIVIQKCLRDYMYDRSMTVAGAKLIEVGNENGCAPEQLELAINEKTAAIHFMAHLAYDSWGNFSPQSNIVSLEQTIKIGHKHNVPIIVDAAFQCYPLELFKKFVEIKADLVAYSCKYFGGPNTAGILAGRKDLIEAVALHSFIGQEGGSTGREVPLGTAKRGAFQSVFRGYKLDRSSIVGAVVALERWMSLMKNPEKALQPARDKLSYIMESLKDIPNVEMNILDMHTKGVDPLRIGLGITLKKKTPEEVFKIVKELMSGNPEIWTECNGRSLIVWGTSFRGLMLIDDGDEKIIAERLRDILSKAC